MKHITLKEGYNLLEKLYPSHFNMYNSYILGKDIDKDIDNLQKWEELYGIIASIELTLGISDLENKISALEQVLHYYDIDYSNLPKEYIIIIKEKKKDIQEDIKMLYEKLDKLQTTITFEIYEDLINE